MEKIGLAEVEYIAFRLAKKLMSFDEAIPDFTTRFPNILESCLAVPFQRFNKKDLYKGLMSKAAILFYLMIKNHPFLNGNKRIAMTTLLVLLHKNGKWLKVDEMVLYNFAIWVTTSPANIKDEVIKGIEKFIESYVIKI
jgi:death-on-curing family protein